MTVSLISSGNKWLATLDEEVIYTTIINNTDNNPLVSPMFKAMMSEWVTFVDKTFSVNGVIYENANPSKGVNIPDIPANGSVKISFLVTVSNYGEPYYDYQGILTYVTGNPPVTITSESNINEIAIHYEL